MNDETIELSNAEYESILDHALAAALCECNFLMVNKLARRMMAIHGNKSTGINSFPYNWDGKVSMAKYFNPKAKKPWRVFVSGANGKIIELMTFDNQNEAEGLVERLSNIFVKSKSQPCSLSDMVNGFSDALLNRLIILENIPDTDANVARAMRAARAGTINDKSFQKIIMKTFGFMLPIAHSDWVGYVVRGIVNGRDGKSEAITPFLFGVNTAEIYKVDIIKNDGERRWLTDCSSQYDAVELTKRLWEIKNCVQFAEMLPMLASRQM